ncbi:family 1 extracellular solute-binding protein [Cellulomonas fimi ATCC 484] [Mycolicibacterium parafortuitum]|uniref:Family 1 extracellular solute-binding protein [Cellulomonas fimi ATCC 484] n=1 Tax=Mycolicibacterium parafortuitum TaxID=39692 RepID=A0A375YKH4_MYCPF|nr:family 1 extracellular solute-binding protein [Cellulomonas fimi ATCC 484] [Mycolicibacterium parafortuitum]
MLPVALIGDHNFIDEDVMKRNLFARGRRRRAIALASAPLVAASLLSACGSQGGPPTLTWYILPDNGGSVARAQECADASGGAYQVRIESLPSTATAQREQMVRRLAAGDSSIDLVSMDVVFTAEFANAGFLRPYTDEEAARLTAGMLPAPIETGIWEDTLYGTPYKTNAQLLWYRKSAAAAAGVDPTSPTFTWDEMLKAAVGQKKKIAVQAQRYEGYTVLINALVLSGGGALLEDVEAGRNAKPSLNTPPGLKAAEIVGNLGRSPAAPTDLSNASEEQARANFQSEQGMFMVNWPYVLAAARSAAEEGTLPQEVVDDIGWARYPRVSADRPSAPPLGGANLGIGAYTKYPEQAVALVECINAEPKATQYMLDESEPSPYAASYDNPEIRATYDNADLIRESIGDGGPRPPTPFYTDISGAIQQTWHPPASVTSETPERTDQFMADVLAGRRLL